MRPTKINKVYKLTSALTLIANVVACSGGGGGGSLGSSSSSSSSATISGTVSAGPVNSATVTAYALNSDGTQGSQLASTTSDSSGKYTLNLSQASGPILVIASGGTYTEEASGSTVSMGSAQIRAALPSVTDGQTVGVTPVTEIATQTALAAATTSANGSASMAGIVRSANKSVASAMGLTDITIPPANPNQPASSASSTQAAQYAVVLASISQMAKSATTTAGSTVNSQQSRYGTSSCRFVYIQRQL